MGQEDVQHCLPAWLCRGAGIYLSSTILPGFFSKCDIHPRTPVSMLRSGIKEASGRCVLREEEEESVLMKGRYYVSSGRHCCKLSTLESHNAHVSSLTFSFKLRLCISLSLLKFFNSLCVKPSLIRSILFSHYCPLGKTNLLHCQKMSQRNKWQNP